MLTINQTKVLDFIAKSIRSNGIAPSIQEVAEATSLSYCGARKVMITLEKLECIRRPFRKLRAISVLRLPDELKSAA